MCVTNPLSCHWFLTPETAELRSRRLPDGTGWPFLGHVAVPLPIEKGLKAVLFLISRICCASPPPPLEK